MRTTIAITAACMVLGAAGLAQAARFCEHGGKKYTIFSTRCEDGKKLRCVAENEWKEIGKCKAPAAKKGPQFCEFGGKKYAIFATRCEDGKHLRCVAAPDKWKEIGKCKK